MILTSDNYISVLKINYVITQYRIKYMRRSYTYKEYVYIKNYVYIIPIYIQT